MSSGPGSVVGGVLTTGAGAMGVAAGGAAAAVAVPPPADVPAPAAVTITSAPAGKGFGVSAYRAFIARRGPGFAAVAGVPEQAVSKLAAPLRLHTTGEEPLKIALAYGRLFVEGSSAPPPAIFFANVRTLPLAGVWSGDAIAAATELSGILTKMGVPIVFVDSRPISPSELDGRIAGLEVANPGLRFPAPSALAWPSQMVYRGVEGWRNLDHWYPHVGGPLRPDSEDVAAEGIAILEELMHGTAKSVSTEVEIKEIKWSDDGNIARAIVKVPYAKEMEWRRALKRRLGSAYGHELAVEVGDAHAVTGRHVDAAEYLVGEHSVILEATFSRSTGSRSAAVEFLSAQLGVGLPNVFYGGYDTADAASMLLGDGALIGAGRLYHETWSEDKHRQAAVRALSSRTHNVWLTRLMEFVQWLELKDKHRSEHGTWTAYEVWGYVKTDVARALAGKGKIPPPNFHGVEYSARDVLELAEGERIELPGGFREFLDWVLMRGINEHHHFDLSELRREKSLMPRHQVHPRLFQYVDALRNEHPNRVQIIPQPGPVGLLSAFMVFAQTRGINLAALASHKPQIH